MKDRDEARRRTAADPRSSEELLELIVKDSNSDKAWKAIAILHARGGKKEFRMGKDLAANTDPYLRRVGAGILAQLGWGDSFHSESVEILIKLLKDPDGGVVKDAGIALGHRHDPSALPYLLKLVAHPDPGIRYGVVSGLTGLDESSAIEALIVLSTDSHREVRNWATFGLGSQTEVDTPKLREALVQRLSDEDPEIRGEALVGLARRKDPRVIEPIKKELRGEYHGNWAVEAAELLADPCFLPLLKDLWKREAEAFEKYHRSRTTDALAACDPSKRDPSTSSG